MPDFLVLAVGFADEVESVVVSGARKASGLGLAEGTAVASLFSLLDVVDCVDEFDWPRANGERRRTRAAASTRGFIVLQSLLGLSQYPEQGFTLIRTLQEVRVLTRPR